MQARGPKYGFYFGYNPMWQRNELIIGSDDSVASLCMHKHAPGEDCSPTMVGNAEDFQALFDVLWKSGFRPQKPEEGSAKDEHIADLRKVLDTFLGTFDETR